MKRKKCGRKRKRGRPKGSLNKVMDITPIKRVDLQCRVCRKHFKGKFGIRTDSPELYTPEVKKNYVCPLCKDTWKHRLLDKGLIKIDKRGRIK